MEDNYKKTGVEYSWFIKPQGFIFIVFLIFLLIFGMASKVEYQHYKNAINHAIKENKTTTNLLAVILQEHQKAAIGIIQSYSRRRLLINAAKEKAFNEAIKYLANLKENNPEIDIIFITDKGGTLWVNYPIYKESHGKNLSYRDWYKGVSEKWNPHFSGVYQRVIAEKDLAVAVCAPILDEKGEIIGIIGVSQRTVFLGNIIEEIVSDPDTKVTLIDQVGHIIYSNKFLYKRGIIDYPPSPFVTKVIQGEKGKVEIQDPSEGDGIKYVSFTPIKGIGWSVIVEKGKKEALRSEVWDFIQNAVIFVLLFLLMTVLLVYFRKEFIYKQMEKLSLTEKDLGEKERRYSSLLKNVKMIAVGLDINGNITYTNPFMLKLTGYAQEEVLRKNWFDTFIPEKIKEEVKLVFQELLWKGLHSHYENPILTKSGDERSVMWNNTVLLDIHGEPVGTISIGEDITKRKRMEEEIFRRNRELSVLYKIDRAASQSLDLERILNDALKATLDALGIEAGGIYLLEPDREILRLRVHRGVSDEFAKKMDHVKLGEGVSGRAVAEKRPVVLDVTIYPSEQLAPFVVAEGLQTLASTPLLSGGEPVGAMNLVMRQPRVFSPEEMELLTAIGQQLGMAIQNARLYERARQELGERKQVEEALKSERERLETVTQNIGAGLAIISKDYRTLWANKVLKDLFGDVEEKICHLTYNQQTEVCSGCGVQKVFEKGSEKVVHEQMGKDINGNKVWSEIVATPIRDEKGNITAALELVIPITERKRAEEEKVALQDQLRQSQKMEAIGRLAGGIAHDFNNLLTVIQGYSQLCLLGIKEDSPLKGNIEEIKRAAERAADLTRQLLAFSRRQVMEMRVIDLNHILRNLDKILRRIIGEDIELATILVEDLGRIKTDIGQIEQVMMNLGVNARDAMPNGGKLTIETANVELDEAYAHSHIAVKPGCYVMFSVSDTGMGMTPEVKERVFEPFFTTKGKDKGTGLGLSTVYGIVKQSGGNIWVYSEPGKGTTFKIYLPRVDEPLEELKKKVEIKEIPYGSETILVAEDDEKVRKLTVGILRNYGYAVLEASQSVDAFLICEEHKGPIHLLVTDVVMPKMSGRELAERLLSIHPNIKVLYMSGYTDNAIVHHGVLEEGMNYVQKPFTVDGLARKVREVLDK